MEEVWKDVDNFEGQYQVSNLGRVKSYIGWSRWEYGRIIGGKIHPNGYRYCGLNKNGKRKQVKVSRIVAATFIPNPKNKPTVNHIDGCKANDKAENLEWNTQAENVQHSHRIGLCHIKRGKESPNWGRKHSKEWNEKSRLARIGRKMSNEYKNKQSEIIKAWWIKRKSMGVSNDTT